MSIDAESVTWSFQVYIPVGGNPNSPTEYTDPNAPAGVLPRDVAGTLEPAFDNALLQSATIGRNLAAEITEGTQGLEAAIGGYSNWFVDQIWIEPNPLSFGAIISDTQATLSILSTYRYEERTLQSPDLSAIGGGVTIPSNPLPATFAPFNQIDVTFEAARDGPPDFDTDIDFVFDNQTIAVRFDGRRLVLFWFPPESGVTEQLRFKTDILKARNGKEQRRSLRVTPRQQITYRIRSREISEATAMRTLLLTFRSFTFGFPVWWEQRQVTSAQSSGATTIAVDTSDVDHRVGGSIMVFEPGTRAFFDAQIDSFTASEITLTAALSVGVSADAIVLPVRFAHLIREPEWQDAPGDLLETIIQLETLDNVDLAFADQTELEAQFTTHPEDDYPIVTDLILLGGSRQTRRSRTRFLRIDNLIGVPEQFAEDPFSELSAPFEQDLESLADIRKWRAFAHWLSGSWRPFYMPTYRQDLIVTVDFPLNAASITVENTDLERFFGVNQPRRSLMLELSDGSQYFAQISAIAAGAGNTEVLTLVNPFDAATTLITAADARISWLELVRIDGDVVTFDHRWAGNATVKFGTRTIQQ